VYAKLFVRDGPRLARLAIRQRVLLVLLLASSTALTVWQRLSALMRDIPRTPGARSSSCCPTR
jgi:hypothetical protein